MAGERSVLKKSIYNYCLVAIGIVGFLTIVVSVFGWDVFSVGEIDIAERVIIALLSLLVFAIGLERVHVEDQSVKLEDLKSDISECKALLDQMPNLEYIVAKAHTGYLLDSTDKLFDFTLPLVKSAKNEIRSVVYSQTLPAPESWMEAVAEQLKREVRLTYQTIICRDFSAGSDEFKQALHERHKLFKDSGVQVSEAGQGRQQIYFRVLDTKAGPKGFSVLIVDNKHCAMVFPAKKGQDFADTGIVFYGREEIASELSSYYDAMRDTPSILEYDYEVRDFKQTSTPLQADPSGVQE